MYLAQQSIWHWQRMGYISCYIQERFWIFLVFATTKFAWISAVCYAKVRLDFTWICEHRCNKVRLNFTPNTQSREAENCIHHSHTLKSNVSSALPSSYKPELDSSDYRNDDATTLYICKELAPYVGELDRIDVCCKVSLMSFCYVIPHVTHLHALLHIFASLEVNLDGK